MKKTILFAALIILVLSVISTQAGKPATEANQVEIINAPDNPVPVSITASPAYEYTVIRIETGFPAEAVQSFQEELNSKAIEGWDLVSSNYVAMPGGTHTCFGVMRRPMQ